MQRKLRPKRKVKNKGARRLSFPRIVNPTTYSQNRLLYGENVTDLETAERESLGDNASRWLQLICPAEASLFSHILRGGLLCLILGVFDNLILHAGNGSHWTGLASFVAFGLFVAQTIVLSIVVGLGSRRHLIWWLFFSWSLGLVNLQLILIQFEAGEGHKSVTDFAFSAFVYAFYAAQIGLVIFWAICGTYPRARIRLPVAAVTFMIASHPFGLMDLVGFRQSNESWLGLLTFFIVAAGMTFGILRYLRFELGVFKQVEAGEADKDAKGRDSKGQFGIKHLFIWTTIVAVLFGIGGFVSWQAIFDNIFRKGFVINIGRTLLITVSLVAVVWAVMGETKWIGLRFLILVLFLSAVGLALYGLDYLSLKANRDSLAIGWRWRRSMNGERHFEMIKVWMIWTMLNGMFLASLFLVFRVAGFRFVKSAKQAQSKV